MLHVLVWAVMCSSWWSSYSFWQTSGQMLPKTQALWQPGHLSSPVCAFQTWVPRSYVNFPINTKPVLSSGSPLKTRGDCKSVGRWVNALSQLAQEGDGQHIKPQHSAGALAPRWGSCPVGGGHAANPEGLLAAEARGYGRWLSWSSMLILSCL